ncbi:hypothetical protein E0Z10_g3505 [Xylaria hypoxylon]|uniref:Rhodopsin domain-containing protein n=1 Tax=Xylaria hypoxylon TaxID=37992 RepID=A0A4Z0YNE8_9PEZI|nr:hypothetical protein E0Z10_g3505 [Xylaria hypoxylon]
MATQLTAAELNDTLQPNLIALCTTLVALSTLALSLRLWSNYITLGYRWGWDDVFATLTLVFIISETALILWWIDVGLGRHAAAVSPEDLAKGPKIIFIATFFYDLNISLPKFSALFFYHRIFKRTKAWFSTALWIIGAANAGWLLSAFISTLLQCIPINAVWESVPGAKCFPQWSWFLGTAIPSVLIDFLILVTPLPIIWGLQMAPFRRFSIVVVFLFGYSVIVVSIGRLVTLAQAGSHLLDDLTWTPIQYLDIFRLVRRVYLDGIKGAMPGGRASTKTSSSTTNDEHKGQFIRMGDYPANIGAEQGRGRQASGEGGFIEGLRSREMAW